MLLSVITIIILLCSYSEYHHFNLGQCDLLKVKHTLLLGGGGGLFGHDLHTLNLKTSTFTELEHLPCCSKFVANKNYLT